jgi:hypothetical protein
MKPWVVDQNHHVRAFVAKMAISLEEKPEERENVQENVQKPHHRQVDERIEKPRAGRRHLASAEPGELGVRNDFAERANQIGGMKITAGLTGGNEDSHGVTRFLAGRLPFDRSVVRGTN